MAGFALALLAHLGAGGTAPGPVVLLALAGLIALTAVLITGARLTALHVAVSLAGMQVFLHEAFMRLAAPVGCSMSGMSPPSPGQMRSLGQMSHGGRPALECAAGMAQAGLGEQAPFSSSAMLCAHVAATAVMAALLAYGEKVLWFLAGWVRPPLTVRVGRSELPAVPTMTSGPPRMFGVQLACGGIGRRGPPGRGLFTNA